MECEKCKAERRRRCRIISQRGEDHDVHMQGRFTSAPFVHPFRCPTNHAQRLRAWHFARFTKSRILWIVAHDELSKQTGNKTQPSSKPGWLMYDDRKTGGIPGMFPLILDLPIRFSFEPERNDRLKGVFTNARGWLRGWDLTPEEEKRVSEATEAEVVLYQRPTTLYIEMASANEALELMDGKRIYRLRSLSRTWHLDENKQVEVRRFGFPIVPDFGGTAHSYCGSSLDACIGDLLSWDAKPYKDAAIRGYIIKSRVRRSEDLLLARPYSPCLFRLGAPAGPKFLLETLQGKMTRTEAVTAWKKEDEQIAKESAASGSGEKWPLSMKLECRHCGKMLALTHFSTSRNIDDLWSTCISKGADLACILCLRILGLEHMPTSIVFCDGCQKVKRRKDFSGEMVTRWMLMQQEEPVHCKRCTGELGEKGRQPVDEKMWRCCGAACSGAQHQEHSELDFLEGDLVEALRRGVTARCARCMVIEDHSFDDISFECVACHVDKPLKEFSAVLCKQHLKGEHRNKKKCLQCQYPVCAIVDCNERPSVPVGHNHVEQDGKWYCHGHRYPPCCVCRRVPRPLSSISGKIKFKDWVCPGCKAKGEVAPELAPCSTESVSGIASGSITGNRETLVPPAASHGSTEGAPKGAACGDAMMEPDLYGCFACGQQVPREELARHGKMLCFLNPIREACGLRLRNSYLCLRCHRRCCLHCGAQSAGNVFVDLYHCGYFC